VEGPNIKRLLAKNEGNHTLARPVQWPAAIRPSPRDEGWHLRPAFSFRLFGEEGHKTSSFGSPKASGISFDDDKRGNAAHCSIYFHNKTKKRMDLFDGANAVVKDQPDLLIPG